LLSNGRVGVSSRQNVGKLNFRFNRTLCLDDFRIFTIWLSLRDL
jgi:hypothetical protein